MWSKLEGAKSEHCLIVWGAGLWLLHDSGAELRIPAWLLAQVHLGFVLD